MKKNYQLELGKKLKTAREYLGLSQEEVAKSINISRSAISLFENGQREVKSIELMTLAKLYQRPIEFFTDENFKVEKDEKIIKLARNYSSLSDNDKKELEQFAEFLTMRSGKNDE